MPGRIGIDFGTSNSVVAVWDESRGEGVPLHLPDYGRHLTFGRGEDTEQISVVPSLIHYGDEGQHWIGNQVRVQNLLASPNTFQQMKRYISNRSPRKVKIGGKQVSNFDAGRDFLSTVLAFVAAELESQDEEVAFTVPVEAYEHYEDWLNIVAEAAGMPRVRLIDEPSAAALGYGAHIQPGQIYLVFDFGGGTLDVVIVLIEESDTAAIGRRCRVLGKAGADLGGMTIDQYLFQEVLKRNGRKDSDDEIRQVSRSLLVECEAAKERLSTSTVAEITVLNPSTGSVIASEITRDEFEDILDQHEVFERIDRTIRNAFRASQETGFTEDDINTVLMVGGSSLIPCVRKTVQRIFGKDRVLLDRPLDAVARGAAAFVAGVDFYDHIQHSYSIRYVDPKKGDYAFREIVPRATPYPTSDPISKMTIKPTYDGQTHLGIAIFEMGEERRQSGHVQPLELVFDPSGHARITQVTLEEANRRTHFWINENSPTFLGADPPAKQGEARFEIEFGIDANKRLMITARETESKKLVLRDYPVVKLT